MTAVIEAIVLAVFVIVVAIVLATMIVLAVISDLSHKLDRHEMSSEHRYQMRKKRGD